VCPGSNQYVLGTPYFDKVTLHLEDGKALTLTREGDGRYIQSMTVNGKEYTRNYLDHDLLMQGGDIRFIMGLRPNMQRGTGKNDVPYSFSLDK